MCVAAEYGLDFFHCEKCDDTLYGKRQEAGKLISWDCECMQRRRNLRRLNKSGLLDLIRKCKFDNYSTTDEDTEKLKELAEQYCSSRSAWFYISGKPGSGKTHLCTAICGQLLKDGADVKYLVWPEEAGRLKMMKAGDPPDPEYSRELELIKSVPVLYIDDFFKCGHSGADDKLAHEILNARYNSRKLRTIISSELSLNQLGDKAISGRIRERAGQYVLQSPAVDWRS